MIVDILILANGPGEIATWVRPTVAALREQLGDNIRISVVLSPCPHATGNEARMAQQLLGVDRTQAAPHFWSFLLWGKTAQNWDWHPRGVVLFLGGDQFFAIAIGKRLGYSIVIYAEWEARWLGLGDRFAVRNQQVVDQVAPQYRHKLTVVGDLIADAAIPLSSQQEEDLVAILPGSKPAKLAQGVPLGLGIAEYIHQQRPQTRFIIPVAPTLDLSTLARYGNPNFNPAIAAMGGTRAELIEGERGAVLRTSKGLEVELITEFPAYEILIRCQLCLTTVGANTAELGALGVPMLVLLPTQQLDAMRAWDGIPGLLANFPGVGSTMARVINSLVLRQKRLFAWPNIWAGEAIVPELVGQLQPESVAAVALDLLNHPHKRETIRQRLQRVRGQSGAARKISALVAAEINT